MGNTGQGYDVCSVFNLCLLAPPSQAPAFAQIVPFYSTTITTTLFLPFSPPPDLFHSFSLPHCHCNFLLSCSASVVVKCAQKGPRPCRAGSPLACRALSMERLVNANTALQDHEGRCSSTNPLRPTYCFSSAPKLLWVDITLYYHITVTLHISPHCLNLKGLIKFGFKSKNLKAAPINQATIAVCNVKGVNLQRIVTKHQLWSFLQLYGAF